MLTRRRDVRRVYPDFGAALQLHAAGVQAWVNLLVLLHHQQTGGHAFPTCRR